MKSKIFVIIITVLFCNFFALHAQELQMVDAVEISDSNIVEKNVHPQVQIFQTDSVLGQNGIAEESIIGLRKNSGNWFIPVYLLAVLFYFTFLRIQYPKQLSENITVITNMNLAQQIYRDREFSAGIFSTLILLNFVLVSALLFYLLLDRMQFSYFTGNIQIDIIACGIILIVLYFLRSIIYWWIAIIFPFKTEISFFRFNTRVLLQMAGIILLPFAILSATTDARLAGWTLYCAFVLLLIVYVLRILKGISIGAGFARFHFFYFLLYLCAFEIAPLLIIIKLINTWGINS